MKMLYCTSPARVWRNASTGLMYIRCDVCGYMGEPRFVNRAAAERAKDAHVCRVPKQKETTQE